MSTDTIVSWLWDFGDGNFSTLENPIYQYQDTGVYQVILTVVTAQGCSKQVIKMVEWMPIPILLFTSQSKLAEEIILYPNPTKDVVRLKFYQPTFTDEYSIIICNSVGQEVFIRNNINLTGEQFIAIDTSLLLEGVYFLKVLNRNKMQTFKLSILD